MVQAKVRLSRRRFLQGAAAFAGSTVAGSLLAGCGRIAGAERLPTPTTLGPEASPSPTPRVRPKEAKYYAQLANGQVRCLQCPRRCQIATGARGFCQTRENQKGRLYSLVYGRLCIARPVPIEKSAIFHLLPGTQSYSVATAGCNLACMYCQNYAVARARPEEVEAWDMLPEDVVAKALQGRCPSITLSYSEPTIAFENLLEVAKAARARGLRVLVKTGGYINGEPLKELCGHIDAINVDLKGFSEQFYQQVCQGELRHVLETIKAIKEDGRPWLEVANLVVPGYNDNEPMIRALCAWFKDNLGEEVPLFFSRFEPAYRLKGLPPTPIETLEKAQQIARAAGLRFVYVGNVPGHRGQNTYCPRCGKLLVERVGFEVKQNRVAGGKCPYCGEAIVGRWQG
ncbi:MAG: AmmeMemoRadiSam system radical SAM enzyme [Chloroflexota bacterium]